LSGGHAGSSLQFLPDILEVASVVADAVVPDEAHRASPALSADCAIDQLERPEGPDFSAVVEN